MIEAWDFEDAGSALAGPPEVVRHGSGLINDTYAVRGPRGALAFLQRVNTAIFVPEVHEDIEAVTSWLEGALETPRLIRTRRGDLWHTDPDGGVWRCLTPVGDTTIDKLRDPAHARAAGALVARFHAHMTGFQWDFRSVRPGAHDTPAHMARLEAALASHGAHRLYDRVGPLAERILSGWGGWTGGGSLPTRVIHGDLKISNVRFRGNEAIALIDLDTLAWGTLDVELGDAMRSWCNPATEDEDSSRFDLGLFAAAMEGYASAARDVTAAEWDALVPGVERISWELAARFAWDALEERYFGWDPGRFGTRGEHNLVRAQGQAQLAASVRAQRDEAVGIVRRLVSG